MSLGTVVYDGKIYNLDYMTSEEAKQLLKRIDEEKKTNLNKAKEIVKK